MQIERRKPLEATVGIIGVGHYTYWAQFAGLLDLMQSKQTRFARRVEACGVKVIDFGLVDNPEFIMLDSPPHTGLNLHPAFSIQVHGVVVELIIVAPLRLRRLRIVR